MNETILFYLLVQSAVENAIFQYVHFDLVCISGLVLVLSLCLSFSLLILSVGFVLSCLTCHFQRLNLRRQFAHLWLKVKS